MNNVIIYEQPLNEHIRACLRLEHLFDEIAETIDQPSPWASRVALTALLKILSVIDRPDLKNKLSKALYQHASILTQYENSPQVDNAKLRLLLDDLDGVIDKLYSLSGKLGGALYDSEFLTSIRSHLHNPGGPVNFSLPSYHLWLSQDPNQRSADLKQWFGELNLLERAVRLLLQLTRQFGRPENITAIGGFYQQGLESSGSPELMRLILPTGQNVFPELSVGKHRISVRFYEGNVEGRPKQTTHDVDFKLLFCSV